MTNFQIHKDFILRTPLYSASKFDEFEKILNAPTKDFEESIYLASPVLHAKYIKVLKEDKSISFSKHEKLVISLFKYWSRSHYRSIPFGLFAGCQVGQWDEETSISIHDSSEITRQTGLDMNYLCVLAKQLERIEDIKRQLLFTPNTSIYTFNDTIRYIDYHYTSNTRRAHRLSSVEQDQYLKNILAIAKNGASYDQLVASIEDEDIALEEKEEFVDQMLQSQFLVSNLEPSISGDLFLRQIIETLEQLLQQTPKIRSLLSQLNLVEEQLKQLDRNKYNTISNYQSIINAIEAFEVSFEEGKLFQTNLYKTASQQPTIANSTQQDIQEAITFLDRFCVKNKNPQLEAFANKFLKRYEDRSVNLLEVLDVESGIGFPVVNEAKIESPLLKQIQAPKPNNGNSTVQWPKQNDILFELITSCLAEGRQEIDFKEIEIPEFPQKPDARKPSTMAFMGALLGKKEQEEEQFFLKFVGGSSAINLLGRFAHGSEEIHNVIKKLVHKEQADHPHQLLAEIIHLPEARTGNILKHPTFLKYEIPYLAKHSVESENVINPEDIEVTVSGHDKRIRLWSTKHGLEVIPRLSNAHNFSFKSLPVYHFLASMQNHSLESALRFNFGFLANKAKFLPRIKYGNVVLSRARWKIDKNEITQLKQLIGATELQDKFRIWLTNNNLPKRFLLSEGDNELLIDADNLLAVKMFLNEVKSKREVILNEFLYDVETCPVKDHKGLPYINEVIGAVSSKDQPKRKQASYQVPAKSTRVNFMPGSEWLYFKVYCGEKTADAILSNTIKPFIDELVDQELIEKWFFIRYHDPESHIRIRFYTKDLSHIARIQSAFYKLMNPFLENGVVQNILIDTYKREVERYGAKTIHFCEKWFQKDSENILDFLSQIEGEEGEEYRWQYALVAIDQMLDSFGYSMEEKLDLLDRKQKGFGKELGMNKNLKVQIDQLFRQYRNPIRQILVLKEPTEDYEVFFDVLKAHKQHIDASIEMLNQFYTTETNYFPLKQSIVASFIHMTMNRLFNSEQRLHEFIIYSLLYRFYRSEIARTKKQKKQQVKQVEQLVS